MEIDYNKLSDLIAEKMSTKNGHEVDDEFIKKLVDEMIAHRSPCHELDEKEVESIKNVVKKAKKLDRGIAFITWGIVLYILKWLWDILIVNIHIGGR